MTGKEQPTETGSRRGKVGRVRSVSGNKTVNVVVNTLVKHPRYGKYVRRQTRLSVHDPSNTAQVGDLVEITSCRRLSKSKSWRLVRVVRRATIAQGVREQ